MSYSLNTPDRELTPDFKDSKYTGCEDCNATGKIETEDVDEETGKKIIEKCPRCKGEKYLEYGND